MTTDPHQSTGSSDPVARALDEAYALSRRWLDPARKIGGTLQANGIDPSSDQALPARLVTGFFLDFPMPGRQVDVCSMEFFEGRQALRPRDCAPETAASWERFAAETPIPSLRATLSDLLAQRGGPSALEYAFHAIRAYCDLAEDPSIGIELDDGTLTTITWDQMDLALAIARAIALRRFNPRAPQSELPLPDQSKRALDLAIDGIKELSVAHEMPGVFVMLAEQLVLEKDQLDAHQLEELTSTVASSFDAEVTPDLVDALGTLLRELNARPVDEINTRRVQARMEIASSSAPHGCDELPWRGQQSCARSRPFATFGGIGSPHASTANRGLWMENVLLNNNNRTRAYGGADPDLEPWPNRH